jgi:hypothetical protein
MQAHEASRAVVTGGLRVDLLYGCSLLLETRVIDC